MWVVVVSLRLLLCSTTTVIMVDAIVLTNNKPELLSKHARILPTTPPGTAFGPLTEAQTLTKAETAATDLVKDVRHQVGYKFFGNSRNQQTIFMFTSTEMATINKAIDNAVRQLQTDLNSGKNPAVSGRDPKSGLTYWSYGNLDLGDFEGVQQITRPSLRNKNEYQVYTLKDKTKFELALSFNPAQPDHIIYHLVEKNIKPANKLTTPIKVDLKGTPYEFTPFIKAQVDFDESKIQWRKKELGDLIQANEARRFTSTQEIQRLQQIIGDPSTTPDQRNKAQGEKLQEEWKVKQADHRKTKLDSYKEALKDFDKFVDPATKKLDVTTITDPVNQKKFEEAAKTALNFESKAVEPKILPEPPSSKTLQMDHELQQMSQKVLQERFKKSGENDQMKARIQQLQQQQQQSNVVVDIESDPEVVRLKSSMVQHDQEVARLTEKKMEMLNQKQVFEYEDALMALKKVTRNRQKLQNLIDSAGSSTSPLDLEDWKADKKAYDLYNAELEKTFKGRENGVQNQVALLEDSLKALAINPDNLTPVQVTQEERRIQTELDNAKNLLTDAATERKAASSIPFSCPLRMPGGRRRRRRRSTASFCGALRLKNSNKPLSDKNVDQVNADKFLGEMDKMTTVDQKRAALDLLLEVPSDRIRGSLDDVKRLNEWIDVESRLKHMEDVKRLKERQKTGNILGQYLQDSDLNPGSKLVEKVDKGRLVISPAIIKSATKSMAKWAGEKVKAAGRKVKGCLPGFSSGVATVSSVRLGISAFRGIAQGNTTTKLMSVGKLVGMVAGDCLAEMAGKFLKNTMAGWSAKSATKSLAKVGGKVGKWSKCLKGASKAVGPILGTAVGSGFTIYSLVNNSIDFHKGNTVAIVDVVADVLSLISDIAMTIALIANFGGPVATAVAVAISIVIEIGVGIAKAVMAVENLDKLIGLRGSERFVAGMDHFLGFQIPQYLQTLEGLKKWNNNAALRASWYLGNNTNVHSYVVPSWKEFKEKPTKSWPWWSWVVPGSGSLIDHESITTYERRYELHEDSEVDLSADRTHYVYLHRGRPDQFPYNSGYNIFCQVATRSSQGKMSELTSSAQSYFCDNAFAIESKTAVQSDSSLKKTCTFSLGRGTDVGIGRKQFENLFHTNSGRKKYVGQELDDTFLLSTKDDDDGDSTKSVESGVSGILDGGSGFNFLVLLDTFWKSSKVTLDLQSGVLRQRDGTRVLLQNVQMIIGREDQGEVIRADWRTTKNVQGLGGSVGSWDEIEIPVSCSSCAYDLSVQMNRYTSVQNYATSGNFVYNLPLMSSTKFILKIAALERPPVGRPFDSRHLFNLQFQLEDIIQLDFDKITSVLTIRANDHKVGGKVERSMLELKYKMVPYKTKALAGLAEPSNCRQGDQATDDDDVGGSNFYQPQFKTRLDSENLAKNEVDLVGQSLGEAEIVVTREGQVNVLHLLDVNASRVHNFQNRQGYPNATNLFTVLGGHWHISGSPFKADIFVIRGKFSGSLNGGGGGSQNLVMMEKAFFENDDSLELNLRVNLIRSTGQDNPGSIRIENIQRVMGRTGSADRIVVNCQTLHVDGRGGNLQRQLADVVIVPQDMCSYVLTIVVNARTEVINEAQRGLFTYEIRQEGHFDVQQRRMVSTTIDPNQDRKEELSHTYLHNFVYGDLNGASFDPMTGQLTLSTKNGWRRHSLRQPSSTSESWGRFVMPNVVLVDGTAFIVTETDAAIVVIVKVEGHHLSQKDPNCGDRAIDTEPVFTFKAVEGVNHRFTLKNSTNVKIEGGSLRDTFILEGNEVITGSLEGGSGQNALVLNNLFFSFQPLEINLREGQLKYPRSRGHEGSDQNLNISSINIFEGRSMGIDIITVDCDTTLVDGKGGFDTINIPGMTCDTDPSSDQTERVKGQRSLKIVIPLLPPTVINEARNGIFIYAMTHPVSFDVDAPFQRRRSFKDIDLNDQQDIKTDLDSEENSVDDSTSDEEATHIYQLAFEMRDIQKIEFTPSDHPTRQWQQARVTFTVGGRRVSHKLGDFDPFDGQDFYPHPRLLTSDGVRVAVSIVGGIFFIFESSANSNQTRRQDSVPAFVLDHQRIARKLNVSMLITTEGEKVSIGDGGDLNILMNQEEMEASPAAPTHLVGGQGRENIFQILPTPYTVTLYEGGEQSKHLLDLSAIVGPIREETGTKYKPKFFQKNLPPSMDDAAGKNEWPDLWVKVGDAEVRLFEGTRWAHNIETLLGSTLMSLKMAAPQIVESIVAPTLTNNHTRAEGTAGSFENLKNDSDPIKTQNDMRRRRRAIIDPIDDLTEWDLTPKPMLLGQREFIFLTSNDIEDGAVIDLTTSTLNDDNDDDGDGGGTIQNCNTRATSSQTSYFEMAHLDSGLILTTSFGGGAPNSRNGGCGGGPKLSSFMITDFYKETENEDGTPLTPITTSGVVDLRPSLHGVTILFAKDKDPISLDRVLDEEFGSGRNGSRGGSIIQTLQFDETFEQLLDDLRVNFDEVFEVTGNDDDDRDWQKENYFENYSNHTFYRNNYEVDLLVHGIWQD